MGYHAQIRLYHHTNSPWTMKDSNGVLPLELARAGLCHRAESDIYSEVQLHWNLISYMLRFICLKCTHRDLMSLLFTGSLPEWSLWADLGQAESRRQELPPTLPCAQWRPKHLGHLFCCLPRHHHGAGWKAEEPGVKWCSNRGAGISNNSLTLCATALDPGGCFLM